MNPPHLRHSFLRAMQDELDANQERKGDWDAFRPKDAKEADRWLEEHVDKLMVAVNAGNPAAVREHAADVANIAMKIEETFGLPNTDPDLIDKVRLLPIPKLKPR